MPRKQNAVQNHSIMIANKFFKHVVKFKCLSDHNNSKLHSQQS